jgi:gluconolactonase
MTQGNADGWWKILIALSLSGHLWAVDIAVLADGVQFPEGPAMNAKGELIVCDIPAHTLWRIDTVKGGKTEWLKLEGNPNGAVFDAAGNLWVADSGTHTILKIAPDQKVERMVPSTLSLNAPNDLCFDEAGNLYFTDPFFRSGHEKIEQWVYQRQPNGTLNKLRAFSQPNGIQARAGFLYVAAGKTGVIWRGTLTSPMQWEPWGHIAGEAHLDGMQFDATGMLYVALHGAGAIAVLDTTGKEIKRIPLPGQKPTNVEFDLTGDVLYVTEAEKKQVLALRNFR